MPPPSSPVSPDVVRKVAALSRLSVPESELSVWTEQLGRIVSYIDQLKELPEGPVEDASPLATPLRPDEPEPGCGRQALEENARLIHEHGVVPRIVGGG
jgi:aspartyl/glutamyl-tRNA(Asn/Gln) amidotransferase C subunit